MNQNQPGQNNLTNIENYINAETEKQIQIIFKEDEKIVSFEKEQLLFEKEKMHLAMEKTFEEMKTKKKMYFIKYITYSDQSKVINACRLEKLKAKIDGINTIFEESKNQLRKIIQNEPETYKTVLKNLIIQGLIKLLEDNVNLLCLKKDYDIVCGIVDEAKKEFLDKLRSELKKFKNYNVNITIDNKYFLPETW